MKKMINTSLAWMIAGLAAGVFYREYTKLMGFAGTTALGTVHTHLLVLGMLFFLIAALLVKAWPDMKENKWFSWFYGLYNIGLAGTAIMMLVRGICEVTGTLMLPDAAISGMAGIFHIVLAAGLIAFFVSLKKAVKE